MLDEDNSDKDDSDRSPFEESGSDPDVNFGSISILIPATKAGDADSRNQLLRELQGYLEYAANLVWDRSLGNKVGRSDVIQQSFIQIIKNFESFRGNTSAELRAWIKIIVANEMNGIRRKFHTDKRDVKQERPIDDRDSTSPGIVPSDAHLTPSSEAMMKERKDKFYATLQLLSEEHAEVIRLRNIEQLPFSEIGQIMGRSENAASKLWYRAILEFEKRLKGQAFFDEDHDESSS